MSDAPERIWICTHLGEYGNYYPEAVEAEGDHGGTAAEYIRKDHVDALLKAEREKVLREAAAAAKTRWKIWQQESSQVSCDISACDDISDATLALISKDKTDAPS